MKTPHFQNTLRTVAAAGIVLAGSISAAPAWAEGGADPAPAATSAPTAAPGTPTAAPGAPTAAPGTPTAAPGAAVAAPAPAPRLSESGLAEAVWRDLGMTLEDFNAAGEQARRAADAVPSLRALPGYRGTSLKNGKIAVDGTGPELRARVDQLNQAGPADFVLAAPVPAPAATDPAPEPAPAAPPVPAAAAAPAQTPAAAELLASSTEQLFEAYLREVGPAGLQAVASTDGHFVIRTGGANTPESAPAVAPAPGNPEPAAEPAPGKVSPAEFVARYGNVRLQKSAPIRTEGDLFGGHGFIVDQVFCSAGFGAFSPEGLPVVLTAGHCPGDGPAGKPADIEPPSASPAGGASTHLARPLAPLGTFGFSQFGGPGNSRITGDADNPGNAGTDIAVIERIAAGINVQPAATKWDDVANPGPTSVKIIGATAPVQGQAVCRSGRTTSWSCGTVDELGIYVVGGPTVVTDPTDLRAFHGFLSHEVQSNGGDSGGPWVSGNYALGTHSAGEEAGAPENFAIATTLEDALSRIPGGVQLQLFLNQPELVAPANKTFSAGTPVTGRVPAAPASAVAANSKVRITVGTQELDVPVDAAGNWSFRAPLPAGRLAFSAQTVNGFSRSGTVAFNGFVAPSALTAPEVTTPADAVLPALDRIDGTGMPGATVKLSGDVMGTGTVALDGRWTVPLPGQALSGKVAVTAVLSSPGIADGPAAAAAFLVMPPPPVQATIPDGAHLRHDGLPPAISGSGVDGAEVAVLVDGAPAGTAQVRGGRWSVGFPAGLAAGPHTLSVSQAVDGIASAPATVTFSIEPAPAAPGAAAQGPAEERAAGEPAAAGVRPAGSPGQLADTGAGSLLAAAGLGGGAVVLGGALLASRRRAVR